MNVLLVDDQEIVVESLKSGMDWKSIHVDQVYTAASAMEAKLVLVNFEIDLIISDIEMPGEDGLELFQWAKNRYPDLEGIFLTAHADFSYAKHAIELGGFDYILQPARYSDIAAAVSRAYQKICEKQKQRKMEGGVATALKQRDLFTDGIAQKLVTGKKEEGDLLFHQLPGIFQVLFENCVFYPAMIQVTQWNRAGKLWNDKLVKLVIRNVLEELLEESHGKICIAETEPWSYLILGVADESGLSDDRWRQILQSFFEFVEKQMDFSVAIYPENQIRECISESWAQMQERKKSNTRHYNGLIEAVFAGENASDTGVEEMDCIQTALTYIHSNLNKNISRTDVANMVYLNEDYFSRMFKLKTGYTFKDYVLMKKMEVAKMMLKNTNLSISIIASKVGYDNFSHFSKMFKKMTDFTPQEYRKEIQKK